MKKIVATMALAMSFMCSYAQITINEIFAENETYVVDPISEKYPDYLELYNAGSANVDLSNYYLTDNILEKQKWKFPANTIIQAGKVMLIWADGSNDGLRTNFKLNNSGEYIGLYNENGEVVSQITYGNQIKNKSFGQQPDGSGDWYTFSQPTPGISNIASVEAKRLGKPSSSLPAGFYQDKQLVSLASEPDATITYTMDGSEPTISSTEYIEPIEILKTTVLKAKAFNTAGEGKMLVTTIFINPRIFDLPIISLSTDEEHFFSDETGIYVKGTNGKPGRCRDDNVNWNMDWERPISVEYFSPNGEVLFESKAKTRIMGGCSRIMGQKSLTLVANGSFDYPIFKSKPAKSYKSVVLRNSGNDWGGGDEEEGYDAGTMMRDAMMQYLIKDQMDIDMQEYQPVAVFLNGEYWGMQNLREHLNENYVKNNHPSVDEDNIDLIKNHYDVKDGDDVAYVALQTYLSEHDLSVQSNYDYVASKVDINEFMNYQLSEIFFSNGDWPGNNIRMWRERNDTGKWRFIVYDTDFGFGIWGRSAFENDLEHATDPNGPGWPNPPHSTLLFRKLLENEEFKNEFIQRFTMQLYNTFDSGRIERIANTIRDSISYEMEYHLPRWYGEWNTLSDWDNRVDDMIHWGEERQGAMLNILEDFFNLSSPVNLSFQKPTGTKQLFCANATVNDNINTVKVFADIPVTIEIDLEDKYVFKHWEDENGYVISENQKFEYTPTAEVTLVPVLEVRPTVTDLYINEIVASNKALTRNEVGATPDYIEIYNASNAIIDLSGLYVSDDHTTPLKYRLPQDNSALAIAPNSFVTLWADGKPELGSTHLDWKIDKDGGIIILSSYDGNTISIIDNVAYDSISDNYSYGRYPDGEAELSVMAPTPKAKNKELASTASLYNLTAENLELEPAFHPDITDYSVLLPNGFSVSSAITYEPYGNAQATMTNNGSLYTVSVVSENALVATDYTIQVVSHVEIANTLASVSVDGGALLSEFNPFVEDYLILTSDEVIPNVSGMLTSVDATISTVEALNYADETIITVMSPTKGKREYRFRFVTSEPQPQGYVQLFDDTPSKWHYGEGSYSSHINNGKALIAIDKSDDWDGFVMDFDENILSLKEFPLLQISITSDVACDLRIDFVDVNGISTNGASVTHSISSGNERVYTYNYDGGFYQTWPDYQEANPDSIKEIWFCFNPGSSNLKANVEIDFIKIGDKTVLSSLTPATPALYVSSGYVKPSFDADIYEYSIIDYSNIPTLFMTTDSDDVLITYEQFDQTSSTATVTVAQHNFSPKTYSFELKSGGLSNNTFLSSLELTSGELSPEFDPNVYLYTSIGQAAVEGLLSAETEDEFATVAIWEAPTEYQPSHVVVTAENGDKAVYSVYHTYSEITDVEDFALSMSVYPNPVVDHFSFSGLETANVRVFNTKGQLIASVIDVHEGETIDVSGVKENILIVEIVNDKARFQTALFVK